MHSTSLCECTASSLACCSPYALAFCYSTPHNCSLTLSPHSLLVLGFAPSSSFKVRPVCHFVFIRSLTAKGDATNISRSAAAASAAASWSYFFWQFRRQSLTRSRSRAPGGSFWMHFGKGQREMYCPSLSQLLLLSPFCAHAPALHFEYLCMATHTHTHTNT